MDSSTAADVYLQDSIENAPPIKLVRMLYQGALRFLERATREDPHDPSSRFLHWIRRVDAIVTELRLAIDESVESELTGDLERLYLFCEDELGRAGLERDPERLESVRRVLETLLDAWQRIELESARAA